MQNNTYINSDYRHDDNNGCGEVTEHWAEEIANRHALRATHADKWTHADRLTHAGRMTHADSARRRA